MDLTFVVLNYGITVLWVLAVTVHRQTAIAVYSRQSSYTDREKSSQLMTTAGAYTAYASIN